MSNLELSPMGTPLVLHTESQAQASSDVACAEPPPNADVDAEAPPVEDSRVCRICKKGCGADLIAPCHCDASDKWVHRVCLDVVRVDGANSRAFTNCLTCGCPYLLVLQRAPSETEQQVNERRRWLLQKTVGKFAMVTLALQAWLCLVAVFIRFCDPGAELVKIFNLSSTADHPQENSFWNSLLYHKATYYLAAVLLSAFFTGIGVAVIVVVLKCGPGEPTSARDHLFPDRRSDDCCIDCKACCDSTSCPHCPYVSSCPDCRGCEGLLAAFAIVFAVIGIFYALVVSVVWLHRVVLRFHQLRELRVLTGEYVVQDLSKCSGAECSSGQACAAAQASAPPRMELSDHGVHESPPPSNTAGGAFGSFVARTGIEMAYAPVTAPVTQQSLIRDLQAVYGLEA